MEYVYPTAHGNAESFPIFVRIRAKGFTLRRMGGSLERRILGALGRFGNQIKEARLMLLDENGPKGGLDKKCQVHVSLADGGYLTAEGEGTLFVRALTFSLDRIRAALGKRGQRLRTMRRRKQRRKKALGT